MTQVAGTIVAPTTLTIANEPFASYVRRVTTPAAFEHWTGAEDTNAWTLLRVPLGATIAVMVALLGVSRPDLVAAGAVVPAVAASLPAVMRLIAAFARRSD